MRRVGDDVLKGYISGPMSGIPDHNYPAFDEAADRWRSLGYEMVNPAENFGGDRGMPRRVYLRLDVTAIADCDFLVVLDGWENSDGALMEVHIARELEMPIFSASTGNELHLEGFYFVQWYEMEEVAV